MTHSALDASARLVERHDGAIQRMAGLVTLLPQALKLVF